MANITAAEVNKLRQQTGAGMMDCKKALVEAEGDFETAIELLRKKGQKVAAKRSDRDATEGLVIAKTAGDGKSAVLISLNCETDFVAKNQEFMDMANAILDLAVSNQPASIDELMKLPYNGNELSINDKITEAIGKIGEKIEIQAYEVVKGESVTAYNHPGNKVASIVGLNKAGNHIMEIGKNVAMQVAAMSPIAKDKEDVPQDVINKEIEIGKEQARAEGKPEDILEKIAMGKLNKFYKESTLLNQDFIKDNKKTVSQYLKESEEGLTVTDFKRLSLV